MFRLLFVYTIGLLLLLGATNVAGVSTPQSAHALAKDVYVAAVEAQRRLQLQVPKDHPRHQEHEDTILGLQPQANEHWKQSHSRKPTSRSAAQKSGLRAEAILEHTIAQEEHTHAYKAWLRPEIVAPMAARISADHAFKAEEHHREVMHLMGPGGGQTNKKAAKSNGGRVPWKIDDLRPSRNNASKSIKEAQDSIDVAEGIVAQNQYRH